MGEGVPNRPGRTKCAKCERKRLPLDYGKGKPGMGYTKEDIVRLVKEEDVKFIRMQFTDIFGQLKNVAITASQIEKAVNNQIMLDGSSIEGFVRINESDQYLYPDLDTFVHSGSKFAKASDAVQSEWSEAERRVRGSTRLARAKPVRFANFKFK